MTRKICSQLAISAFLLTLPLASIGCGGDTLTTTLSLDSAFCPTGTAGTSVLPDVLKIESYQITISGDGFDPMVVTLDGKTAVAPVQGIPKGENRTLLIQALNDRSQVICQRELTGIAINGGKLSLIEVSLLAVPFVANLSDGNVVTQTRLVFRGYGEPDGAVEIIDNFNGDETVLMDLDTDSDLVSPSSDDATFTFRPPVLPLGNHLFTVRDSQTGEQSQVRLTLVAPGRMPGTGLSVAGRTEENGVQTIGRNDVFVEALEALSE